MIHNFTIVDLLASIKASVLFTLILFVPGYVFGWLSNVLRFRKRRLVTQIALSTPVAVATVPILVYLLGRYPRLLWAVLIVTWIIFFFLLRQIWSRLPAWTEIPRAVVVAAVFALLWGFVAITTLVDLQFNNRLYFSVPAFDYSLRSAFTAAAARAIPPGNPFFASVPPVVLRYHYFWMLLCGLVTRLGHIGPRQAMYGGTVWAGVVLMSLIAIALKFFLGVREQLERKVLLACGLLLVTGLDILPTIFIYLHFHTVTPDMEWWNEQITSWFDALLWTPHHIMSLVACMVGFLVVRDLPSSKSGRVATVIIAALAFSSAVGLSVLVTFTFATFAAFWLLSGILRKSWREVLALAAAASLAVVFAAPYLSSLMEHEVDGVGGSGRFVAFEVRGFPLVIGMLIKDLHMPASRALNLALPLLPLNYFLELGFFFVVGIARFRSIRAGRTQFSQPEQAAWMMVGTSFLIGSFMKSTTIGSNDLGWRCFLQAQLVLLLWGALIVNDWWKDRRWGLAGAGFTVRLARILLIFGIMGTVYQVAMLRAYPILHDAGKVNPTLFPWLYADQKVGERTYALRSIYDQLATMLPANAVVQYDPYAPAFISHQIYSGHDAAVGASMCGAVFGGDLPRCIARIKTIVPLFRRPSPAQSGGLDGVCRDYKINVMLVDDTDLVWNDPESWVWTRTPLVANQHVRALACGLSPQQARLGAGE